MPTFLSVIHVMLPLHGEIFVQIIVENVLYYYNNDLMTTLRNSNNMFLLLADCMKVNSPKKYEYQLDRSK